VVAVIRHHKEKLDGSGYPDGLKGAEIPVTARILQIVDVYDALTSERPYKRAFSHAEALGVMEQEVRKNWWDASIFQVFCKMPAAVRAVAAGAGG
jgi:putative two-component system response regulator